MAHDPHHHDVAAHDHHHHAPEFRFCPRCGGTLSRQQLKPIEPARLVCGDCTFIFYDDPKVAACTIPILDGKIVLLKRGIEPSYGKWVFPGGFLDRGERVEEAAIRETREEVNLKVEVTQLLNVYSYPGYPVVVVVYMAEVVGGQLQAMDETLEVRTFSSDEVPWDELAFPSTRDALADYLALTGSGRGSR
jgi:ADP-ribose pyrophosphatase YjhB (NUDIX family)